MTEKTTLAERLTEALRRAGKTKMELAKACGISHPSVSAWFSGRSKTMTGPNSILAAKFLGVSPEWLSTGEGPVKPPPVTWVSDIFGPDPSQISPTDTVGGKTRYVCKFYAVPFFTEDDSASPVPAVAMTPGFFEKQGASPENCFAFVAEGEAMAPLVCKGDIVIADTFERACEIDAAGHAYVIRIGAEPGVRILRLLKKLDGSVKAWGENYPAETIAAADVGTIHVLGRVIGRSGAANF